MPSSARTLRYLPLGLLVLGVAWHGFLIEAKDHDPQRGTAFAMFATIDIGATRRVEIEAGLPQDSPVDLVLPESLAEQKRRLAASPSEEAAQRLAVHLLDRAWEVEGRTASVGGDTRFDQLRLTVIGLRADGDNVSRHIFADVVVDERRS